MDAQARQWQDELTHSGIPLDLERKDEETPTPAPPADDADTKKAVEDLCKAFEEFKTKNDERIKEVEAKAGKGAQDPDAGDPITQDQLDKISERMDELTDSIKQKRLAAARPKFKDMKGTEVEMSEAQVEHKGGFAEWMRGSKSDDELRALESKAVAVSDGQDGGLVVPEDVSYDLIRISRERSPIRENSTVQAISGSQLRRPVDLGGASSGWVAEKDSRPETSTPKLNQLSWTTHEVYANPAATQTFLDDAAIDVEGWLMENVLDEFLKQENDAFINGDGTSRPRGLLTYDTKKVTASSGFEWGKLSFVSSGSANGFASSNPSDALIDLIYSMRVAYRSGARFYMNRKTQATIRKFRESVTGDYLWQPGIAAGQPAQLLGHPVVELDELPDVAANAFPIMFGDMRRAYLIVDRIGVRTLRDPYTNKPYVHFYTTKRVGGGILHYEPLMLFKIAA